MCYVKVYKKLSSDLTSINILFWQVFAWLQQVFGEDPIPQFEINSFTLGVLGQLAIRNQEQNKHAVLITKDFIQKTSEYAAEGNEQFIVVWTMISTNLGLVTMTTHKIKFNNSLFTVNPVLVLTMIQASWPRQPSLYSSKT